MNELRFNQGEFCSLSSKGTFTELPTNTTVLSDIQIMQHISKIANGQIPISLLPDILHEFTHHWCFLSPLGSALAALHMRIKLRSMTANTPMPIFHDVIRYETACAILRPLSEGLALFGEFDVKPGYSQLRSPVLFWIWAFFKRSQIGDSQQFDSQIAELLSEMRELDSLWRKKESLFCLPIGLKNGGYLEGYLVTKKIWNKYRKQSMDSELLWSYIRSFFFDDYQFVKILLDPTLNTSSIVNDLLTYFSHRLNLLQEANLELYINEFHDFVTSQPLNIESYNFDNPELTPGLLNNSDEVNEGVELSKELFFEVQESHPELAQKNPEAAKIMTTYARLTLGRRKLICLASDPAIVEVNEHQRAIVYAANFTAGIPALPDAERISGEGALEFYYSPLTYLSAWVAVIETKPVAIFFHDKEEPSPALIDDFLNNAFNRNLILSTQKLLDEKIEDFLNLQEGGFDLLSATREIAAKHVEVIYLEQALSDVFADCYTDILQDLKSKGLWTLLGSQLRLVRGTAFSGIAQIANLSIEDIRIKLSNLDNQSIVFDEVFQHLEKIKETTGLYFIDEEKTVLI